VGSATASCKQQQCKYHQVHNVFELRAQEQLLNYNSYVSISSLGTQHLLTSTVVPVPAKCSSEMESTTAFPNQKSRISANRAV
jgi:hypothetical protein